MGEVSILNVGAGDTKLVFDPSDPDECERSGKIVTDMIRRGFVLLVEVGRDENGPLYRRALDFDPSTCEYIVAGFAGDVEEPADVKTQPKAASRKAGKGSDRPPRRQRIPARTTKATAVSKTAGG